MFVTSLPSCYMFHCMYMIIRVLSFVCPAELHYKHVQIYGVCQGLYIQWLWFTKL
jgi:hypothetical protein